ncbi:flagellar hook-associated protein FlgK [Muricoccus aerilatus]|uniref:flagellar hook-associated protein FlgK n=1 Tax=Muricoccus aerilatus TaxID=452982 RepID=UPI0005C231AC|nr:flagellar basal body rod C-terminal domain-containing protein [Roseomonas aerilata]
MSLDLALSIARSGLSHINRQLAQSAANVANAATPGYTRKEVQAASNVAGGLSAGVRSQEATREVDTALVMQMNAARAATGAAEVRTRLLQGVEVAHGAAGQSIGDLTAALGDAFVALRANPSDALLQARAVDAADGLAARYNTVSAAVQSARQDAQDGMVADVDRLNGALRQVSSLTDQILPMRVQGRSTAELEDQRDAAIATISSIMEVRAVAQPDGGVTLISAGGLNLPLRSTTGPFFMDPATTGVEAFHGAGGSLPGVILGKTDITAQLGRGTLAAYADLRDRELPLAQAELDVSAANLASRFDAQGLTLFSNAAGTVPDPSTPYATGGWIGFAGFIGVNAAVRAEPAQLRDGSHAVADGAGGASGFTPNPPGGPADFTTLLDRVLNRTFGPEVAPGTAQPGFAITGLGPDGTLSSRLRAARTLGDQAAQVVSSQTSLRAVAEVEGKSSGDLLTSLETRFAARSGVDMDKELAAMVTLQTAYSANARILSVVQSMYDNLLQAVR